MSKSSLDDNTAANGIRLHNMEQRHKRLQIALLQYPELAKAKPFENVTRFAELRDQVIEPTMHAFSRAGSLGNYAHHVVTDKDHTDEALAVVGAGIRLILSDTALPNGINLYEIPTLSFYHDRLEQYVQCRVEIYDASRDGDDRLVHCLNIETPLDFDAVTAAAIETKLNLFMEALAQYSI